MASTKAPGPGEKHHSIDTQLHQLVPGKVSEDDKLIEYDALLIDHFLNILQDLHRPSLREFVTNHRRRPFLLRPVAACARHCSYVSRRCLL
jgi:hypothetical protein